jgi:hypothetical protein
VHTFIYIYKYIYKNALTKSTILKKKGKRIIGRLKVNHTRLQHTWCVTSYLNGINVLEQFLVV